MYADENVDALLAQAHALVDDPTIPDPEFFTYSR